MKSIFSYDSKFMSILDSLANTMILNAMFLIFSIPIVTVGAAYTGLYSGCRALARKEPCFRAFFKGFKDGFKRSTIAWLILAAVDVLAIFNLVCIVYYRDQVIEGYMPALVLGIASIVVLMSITTMVFIFYSRFECTLGQLLKNSTLIVLSYPLRSVILAALTWLPTFLFFWNPYVFMQVFVVWLLMYFGCIGTLAVWLMNKPFRKLAIAVFGEDVLKEEDAATEDVVGEKSVEA